MGIRFRQRIKIAPGVNVNLSKSGASVSAGAPGATINVGKGGAKATVGIPGSGLSHTQQLSAKSEAQQVKRKGLGFFGLLGYGVLALLVSLVLLGLFAD